MVNYYNKDLYKILNINFDASSEDIKSSYRKLVRIYHPDVSGNKSNIEKFKEIQEAYEILIDKDKRRKYDVLNGFFSEKIKENFQKTQSEKNIYDETLKRAKDRAEKAEPFSKSINEALDNLFHTKKHPDEKKEKKTPVNGKDIKLDISLTCFEALQGTNRKVNILHTQPCPNCEGRMFINGSICPSCNGTGQISLQKKINVKIPKGVKQGSKVRIKKEGNKGLYGGKDGDLYLVINIEKNQYFEIAGMDIYCNLPVTPYEAALGADIPIKIMNETINIKIPPMTSSGQKLKLAGLGLDNKSKTKKGDIIVTVIIKLPETLSEKEKQLYNQLKDIVNNDIREEMNNGK